MNLAFQKITNGKFQVHACIADVMSFFVDALVISFSSSYSRNWPLLSSRPSWQRRFLGALTPAHQVSAACPRIQMPWAIPTDKIWQVRWPRVIIKLGSKTTENEEQFLMLLWCALLCHESTKFSINSPSLHIWNEELTSTSQCSCILQW